MTDRTRSSGALAPAVTPTTEASPRNRGVELVGAVDANDAIAAGPPRDLDERERVRRVRAADHDDRVGALGDDAQRGLAVRGREAEVAAGGGPEVGVLVAGAVDDALPVVERERRLREHRDLGRRRAREARCRGRPRAPRAASRRARPRACPRPRRDRRGRRRGSCSPSAARTLASWCTFVTSGHTAFTTKRPCSRAAATISGALPCADSMRGAPGGTVVDGVDEDHALGLEPLDDEPVVDDLVVAVDGRLEDPHHPHQRLDRHLDPGAEPPGLGQQHALTWLLGFGTPRPPVEATEPEARSERRVRPAERSQNVPVDSSGADCPYRGGCARFPGGSRRAPPRRRALAVNGEAVRDVIRYQLQVDEPVVELELRRGGLERQVVVEKRAGEPLGLALTGPVFDRVRTCDNHCPFCFIYQLPAGHAPSLS